MRRDIFGLAKQADIETKQTTMEFFPPVESVDPGHDRETLEIEETTGTRFPTGLDYGVEFWEIQAEGACRFASLPRIASGFLCAPITTTPDVVNAPTARQHAFDPAGPGAAPVPHSLFVVRADPSPAIVDLFWASLGDELVLSVETNDYMKFQGTWVAKELDDTQVAPTPTTDVSKRITFDQCKAFVTVNGGAEVETPVAGFSLTYSNGIDTDDEVLGSRRLFTVEEGNANAEVSFMPRNGLSDHYRRALKSDPDTVKIRLVGTGAVIGGTVAYKVEVIVHACETIDAPAEIDASERLKSIEVTARAKYDEAAGKFVELLVTNETTGY